MKAIEENPLVSVMVKLNKADYKSLKKLGKKHGHKPGPHLSFRIKKFLSAVDTDPNNKAA